MTHRLLLDGQKLEWHTIRKLRRKRYENRPLQMDIQCEDIYIPCECIPKGDFSKENFNNQMDKMTIKYRCQLASFPQTPLLLPTVS